MASKTPIIKKCINCGKIIPSFTKSYTLYNEDIHFCKDCMGEAKELLKGVRSTGYSELTAPKFREKFKEDIEKCSYNDQIKDMIKHEYDVLDLKSSKSEPTRIRRCHTEFDELYKAIQDFGMEATHEKKEPYIVETGETKSATFYFEAYIAAFGTTACLTVNIVNWGGISTITTIGSGGKGGLLKVDFGTCKELIKYFWDIFEADHPEWELETLNF